MANLLSPDSKVMTGINKVVDMIWLSLLWCLFCLPVVWIFFVLSMMTSFGTNPEASYEAYRTITGLEATTDMEVLTFLIRDLDLILMIEMLVRGVIIGPTTAALYYTIVKTVRRERGYATRTFFHGIKVNFRTGAPASMLLVIFGILMIIDFRYIDLIQGDDPTFSSVLNIALLVVCIFVLFIMVWLFPILSRFTIGLKALFKNAMLISIKHFIGSFVVGGGIVLVFWFIFTFAGDMSSILILFPFILPAGIALLSSFIIEPVLKRYTGSQNQAAAASKDDSDGESIVVAEDPEADSSTDEWYME
ncbi:MAG: DUF624 domain-containing protein [Lachnospiraceae bacterium]|nr:DUF624 domain-containing protein [Lachnospiraceae bacterium]